MVMVPVLLLNPTSFAQAITSVGFATTLAVVSMFRICTLAFRHNKRTLGNISPQLGFLISFGERLDFLRVLVADVLRKGSTE